LARIGLVGGLIRMPRGARVTTFAHCSSFAGEDE